MSVRPLARVKGCLCVLFAFPRTKPWTVRFHYSSTIYSFSVPGEKGRSDTLEEFEREWRESQIPGAEQKSGDWCQPYLTMISLLS